MRTKTISATVTSSKSAAETRGRSEEGAKNEESQNGTKIRKSQVDMFPRQAGLHPELREEPIKQRSSSLVTLRMRQ